MDGWMDEFSVYIFYMVLRGIAVVLRIRNLDIHLMKYEKKKTGLDNEIREIVCCIGLNCERILRPS